MFHEFANPPGDQRCARLPHVLRRGRSGVRGRRTAVTKSREVYPHGEASYPPRPAARAHSIGRRTPPSRRVRITRALDWRPSARCGACQTRSEHGTHDGRRRRFVIACGPPEMHQSGTSRYAPTFKRRAILSDDGGVTQIRRSAAVARAPSLIARRASTCGFVCARDRLGAFALGRASRSAVR